MVMVDLPCHMVALRATGAGDGSVTDSVQLLRLLLRVVCCVAMLQLATWWQVWMLQRLVKGTLGQRAARVVAGAAAVPDAAVFGRSAGAAGPAAMLPGVECLCYRVADLSVGGFKSGACYK